MPPIRKTEKQKKDDLLRAYVAKNMSLCGYQRKSDLAPELGCTPRTLYRKLKNPDYFTRWELCMLFRMLKFSPDEKMSVF